MIGKHWEHFNHDADIGVRGIGATIEEAFEQAALALIAVITNPFSINMQETVEIACEAPDDELLLADWLNALIYQMATRKLIFGRFDVRIKDHCLQAKVAGEPVDISRHQPAVEIKGATYTCLQVKQDAAGAWLAQCVVDV